MFGVLVETPFSWIASCVSLSVGVGNLILILFIIPILVSFLSFFLPFLGSWLDPFVFDILVLLCSVKNKD